MARLIDIDDIQSLPSILHLNIGDLLMVKASGGFVKKGESSIERLGPFILGVLQKDHSILSPIGSPGTVIFVARKIGQATIAVATGDPFFNPQLVELEIRINP